VARLTDAIRSPSARRALVVFLGFALLAEYASKPLTLQIIPTGPSEAYADMAKDLGDSPTATIFEYPPSLLHDPTYMYYSTFHWQNLVNGYAGFFPQWYGRLTLAMERGTAGTDRSFGFKLSGDGIDPAADRMSTPGPTLVLRRDEPVEITVVNHLGERTALHWHGMELESIYDGVHGWSGIDKRLAPMIEPDSSFIVRFTPPRTGTFMYHTHVHDERQLPLGMYGPMIVIDPEQRFNPETDHVLILGRSGVDPSAPNVLLPTTPVVVNGERAPELVWTAGTRHRVRLINITPDDIFSVSLETPQGPVAWTPITKDGAPLPEGLRKQTPARQTIAVGETYDFAVDLPPGRRRFWIEVRSTAGKWEAQGVINVR